jgi:hypothetical protein
VGRRTSSVFFFAAERGRARKNKGLFLPSDRYPAPEEEEEEEEEFFNHYKNEELAI